MDIDQWHKDELARMNAMAAAARRLGHVTTPAVKKPPELRDDGSIRETEKEVE